MNHYNRKLYLNLAPTPTTNDQNKNISCPDICVDLTSTCPYDCYPYADDSYPISPPLLPPEPPTGGRQQQPISTLLIIIITVLAIGFLLISYYFIIVKFCKRWNPFRPPRGRHSPPQDAMNEEFLDENRGPEIDHPIWFINTIGLQQSIINSIAVFRYKKYDNLIEGTECSICLNEFLNEETLRLLPKCNHAFHVHCIDTWLRSHTNCPVCRAGIVSSVAMANHGINPIIIPVDADSERENSESGELINHSDEVRDDENRGADTNDVADFLDDNNEGTIDKSCADSKEKNGIQSVRRSVSVDSFMAADISRAVNGEEEFLGSHEGSRDDKNGEGNCRGERMNAGGGSSSITEFFRKKPVRMQRSFTYSGRSKQETIP